MNNLLYRVVNGALVWHLLAAFVAVWIAGSLIIFSACASFVFTLLILIVGLVLAIKNG